ncbi:vWA-MoxR associated conflict system protein [Streptomyces justiciae]|uniref:vWA-MoxR associated protein middle region 2 domain-containing protein n=1 Tax=Streptomyces justiciae TaxID=2780140 RepID=A0ABU3M8M2_9ACTN|nr:hypothetical protein [Streptomyces justiciae]MDT7847850.1 hypothetical protein [Streptomyces justiciae]
MGGHVLGSAVGDGNSVVYIGQQIVTQVLREDRSALHPDVLRAMSRDNVAGTIGGDELREAVMTWHPDHVVPAAVSFDQLVAWQRELAAENRPDDASGRMACAVAGVMECAVTAEFLADVFADVLTSDRLTTVARLAGLPADVLGVDPLRGLLECAAFEAQPLAAPPGAVLARVVAAFVSLSEIDRTDSRLKDWSAARGLVVQLNDAIDEFTRPAPGLRLVISLADVRRDSQGDAEYWLVRGGTVVRTGDPISVGHEQAGVIQAIKCALKWARGHLMPDETLVHVDVAAPVSLLVDLMSKTWALEDQPVGMFRLGARHSLLMRWSGRLGPDPSVPDATDIAEINDAARKALQKMPRDAEPVKWLDHDDFYAQSEENLRRRLAAGRMGAAIGFNETATLDRVLTILLPYAPIVVWPRPGATGLDDAFRARVRAYWHRQPQDFADAFRRNEAGHSCDECLCDLHSISHDEPWLDFCWLISRRTVAAPKETQ